MDTGPPDGRREPNSGSLPGASPVRSSSGQSGRGLGLPKSQQRDPRGSERGVEQRETPPHGKTTGKGTSLITIQALTLRHESVGKEDDEHDGSLKPFIGTLRVTKPVR